MINEVLTQLIENQSNPREYNEIIKNISAYNKENTNQLIECIDKYINQNYLICVIDIFLELKYKKLIDNVNLDKINKKIVEIYKKIPDENIRYYILGYIIQNNLVNEDIKQDNIFIKYYDRKEKDLFLGIMKAIDAYSQKSAFAIKMWCESSNDNINIFKVGELLREKLINDEKLKTIFYKITDEMLELMNEDDKEKNIKDLSFILSIYQDSDFINIFVMEKIIPKINKIISRLDNRFLNNIFIELTETIGFNKVANRNIYNTSSDDYRTNKSIKSAARGNGFTQKDYTTLDCYLNKVLKTNKKIRTIKMRNSYNANEILKLTKIEMMTKVNLEEIMERLNIQYYETKFEADIEGFSFKLVDQNKAAIIINKNVSGVRRRFTIAHELGHICTNNNELESNDNLYNLHLYKNEEKIADNFAGELLIPEVYLNDLFKKDIDMNKILQVSREFNISIEATGIRIIKVIKGSYVFGIYKDNKEKYLMYSDDAKNIKIDDQISYFIMSNEVNESKFINNAKVSMVIKGDYKYIILNYIYNR